jgi:SAM-dependent methyltransferase
MHREHQERNCPSCGGQQFTSLPRYSTEAWHIVRCVPCGLVYLRNAPDYDRLVSEFAWEKSHSAAAAARKAKTPLLSWVGAKTRWRISLFSPDLAQLLRQTFPPGRVLDVGCGGGETVPEPFVPFGIELSEALARQAHMRMAARGGRTIHAPATSGMAQFPDAHFSGVILHGFIKHEKNPKPLLREVRRVLADNGAVYVRTPNYASINRRVMGANWCGFHHPDHVNYFTPATLRKMTAECGFTFQLLSLLRLPFDDSMKAILRKA